MATILDKDITRETTIVVDGREIQITLTESQKVSMKLKGMKSGIREIGISELYNQLGGEAKEVEVKEVKAEVKTEGMIDLSDYRGDSKYLISLHDIRHAMLVKPIDLQVKQQFEAFLVELIKERKNRK